MKKINLAYDPQLLLELESMENMGITILMDGISKNAVNAATDLQMNEISNYMRDYVIDEVGIIKELRFDRVKSS